MRTSIKFDIWGNGIKQERASRAVQLSIVKYCSVFNSLRSDMRSSAAFRIHATGSEASGDYTEVPIADCEE